MHDRDQEGRERAKGRQLDELTTDAIDEGVRLAEAIASAQDGQGPDGATRQTGGERIESGIDVAFAAAGDAVYARKRLNEALAIRELVDLIEVWVWQADRNVSPPLTEAGAATGFELRVSLRPTR